MKKIKNIVILAGGESSRFWPLADKSVFNFSGAPLMAHTIERLQTYAEKIFVVINEKNQQMAVEIASLHQATLIRQHGHGQSAALQSASGMLSGSVLVVNNNDLFDNSLIERLLEKVEQDDPDCILVCTKVDRYVPGGYLTCAEDKVTNIVEKPGAQNMPSPYFRLVVDYIKNSEQFIDLIEKTVTDHELGYEETISRLIAQKKDVRFIEYAGPWATIKYPWHVLDVGKFFLSQTKDHRGDNVEIDKTAIIKGDVYIEDGVKILEYAKIVGPAYIGKNTVIGNFALVVESMIGDNCVIGGYGEVTRSYLGKNVWLHRNYIGDSVLGDDILCGAGAVCANFRFDQKTIPSIVKGQKVDTERVKLGAIIGSNARVGVNSSIMPGVKIGGGKIILPGQVLKQDL